MGFDVELTRRIAQSVPIPVIACGGAGKTSHVREAIEEGRADAVSIASMFHYNVARQIQAAAEFSSEGNVEYLKSNKEFSRVEYIDLPKLKAYLTSSGIPCREVANERIHA